MESLNNLIIEIFGFLYYYHFTVGKIVAQNLISYPYATYLVCTLGLIVIYKTLYILMILKNRHFSYYGVNDYSLKQDIRMGVKLWLLAVIFTPFLIPFLTYVEFSHIVDSLEWNKQRGKNIE